MEIEKFNLRPRCPKCLQDRWSRAWRPVSMDPRDSEFGDTWPEHLRLLCETCGYSFLMQTAEQAGHDPNRQ